MVPHVASSPRQRSIFSVTSVASSGPKASHSEGRAVPRFLRLFSATRNREVSLKETHFDEEQQKSYKTEHLNSNNE